METRYEIDGATFYLYFLIDSMTYTFVLTFPLVLNYDSASNKLSIGWKLKK